MSTLTTTTATSARRALRRRVLLAGLTAAAAALTLLVSPACWPLLALPMIVAPPLAGRTGAVLTALAAAGTMGVVAGRPGTAALELVIGWCAFAAGAAAVAARHDQVQRDLDRVTGAALRDRLTGLHNFAFFSDTLRRETERTRRYGGDLTLVLFDLDAFKSFNDTHGHEAGNRLLAAVGGVIESQRRSADIAARFGGEEFALLVPADEAAAWEAADRIRLAVARVTVPVGNGQHDSRTISAGVAAYHPGDTPEILIEAADRALYASKRRGRNRVSVAGRTTLTRAAGA